MLNKEVIEIGGMYVETYVGDHGRKFWVAMYWTDEGEEVIVSGDFLSEETARAGVKEAVAKYVRSLSE